MNGDSNTAVNRHLSSQSCVARKSHTMCNKLHEVAEASFWQASFETFARKLAFKWRHLQESSLFQLVHTLAPMQRFLDNRIRILSIQKEDLGYRYLTDSFIETQFYTTLTSIHNVGCTRTRPFFLIDHWRECFDVPMHLGNRSLVNVRRRRDLCLLRYVCFSFLCSSGASATPHGGGGVNLGVSGDEVSVCACVCIRELTSEPAGARSMSLAI